MLFEFLNLSVNLAIKPGFKSPVKALKVNISAKFSKLYPSLDYLPDRHREFLNIHQFVLAPECCCSTYNCYTEMLGVELSLLAEIELAKGSLEQCAPSLPRMCF